MQQTMEQEIKKQMEMLYPNSPDHLYNKMQVESTIHGGIIAAAIDTTCGAIVRNVSGSKSIPTINLNINYLSPGLPGDALLVTATADRAGRKVCNVHAVCRSEKNDKIIATATANFMILD